MCTLKFVNYKDSTEITMFQLNKLCISINSIFFSVFRYFIIFFVPLNLFYFDINYPTLYIITTTFWDNKNTSTFSSTPKQIHCEINWLQKNRCLMKNMVVVIESKNYHYNQSKHESSIFLIHSKSTKKEQAILLFPIHFVEKCLFQ